jgi:hypothetical protein
MVQNITSIQAQLDIMEMEAISVGSPKALSLKLRGPNYVQYIQSSVYCLNVLIE